MTLEKQIEILRDLLTSDPPFVPHDCCEAARLALADLEYCLWASRHLTPPKETATWPEEEK